MIAWILAVAILLCVAYLTGRAQASVDYARDEEGYIDRSPADVVRNHFKLHPEELDEDINLQKKDCQRCEYYQNVTDMHVIKHLLDGEYGMGFCDYCAHEQKKFFKQKKGQ